MVGSLGEQPPTPPPMGRNRMGIAQKRRLRLESVRLDFQTCIERRLGHDCLYVFVGWLLTPPRRGVGGFFGAGGWDLGGKVAGGCTHSSFKIDHSLKSADSSACWNQSQPTKTSRQSWPSRLSIHVRKFNPTDSRRSLLSEAIPMRFFSTRFECP